jgi:hypothetical protein
MCRKIYVGQIYLLETPIFQYYVTGNHLKFFMLMNATLPYIMWHCYLTVSDVCIEVVNCNEELYIVYA